MKNCNSLILFKISAFFGAALSVSAHAALNDTGITWCANDSQNNLACPLSGFPRQDGDFGRDVTNNDNTDGHAGFSFTKLDAQGKDLPAEATSWDCVRDNVTGMIWENKTSDGKLRDSKWTYTWYKSGDGTSSGGTCYQSGRCDTEKYAQDVNAAGLCGFKDWRMPSPIELASIVDYSEYYPAPTIDTDYFSNTVSDWFWASSPYASSSSFAWRVGFDFGYVDGYGKYGPYRVRLVRSGQYFLLFEDLNDGTVAETSTGLMWAKCTEGLSGTDCKTGTAKSFTWKQALQAANKSRLAGYDDWRLPNVKELQSLVDYSTYSPAIDSTYFPNIPSVWFWASSPYAGSSYYAWNVNFGYGYVSNYNKPSTSQVRLVRDLPVSYLTVTKMGDGSGTVVSNPEGIDCGSNCSTKFQQNSSVTLTATADSESTFGGWSGAGCSGTGTCVVKMDAAKSVIATFTKNSVYYTLSISKVGNGTVTSTDGKINCGTGSGCSASYLQNTSVTINAKPDNGYKFDGWSGSNCSGTGSCTITLNSNSNVTANFSQNPVYYTLTVNKSGNGTVTSTDGKINCGSSCSVSYLKNTQVTLNAVADSGYTFSGWSGSNCSGTGTCTITVTANSSVTASFSQNPVYYTLEVNKLGNGTGTVTSTDSKINCGSDCTENYVSGMQVTLNATPDDGSTFGTWGGDCASVGTATTCTITMNQARNVSATFNLITPTNYSLTVTKPTGGLITSSDLEINCGTDCKQDYPAGTLVTLTATPTAGFSLQSWTGDCSGTQNTCQIKMDQAHQVGAIFNKPGLVRLIVHLNGGGGNSSVTRSPEGTSCGIDCYKYSSGTTVTLTANPASGYTFAGWVTANLPACNGSQDPCTITLTQNQTITAYFNKIVPHTLKVTNNNKDYGKVTSDPLGISCGVGCSMKYPNGTEVTLTATANPHYFFNGWGQDCLISGNQSTCHLTMLQDHKVKATFQKLGNYVLTVNISKPRTGTVTSVPAGISKCVNSCASLFEQGQVSLTATAKEGYVFDSWEGDACAQAGSSTVCVINLTQPTIVTANFVVKTQ